MLKLLSSGEIEAFNLFINSEKDILQLNIFSPISRIEEDKNEFILINCSKIKSEQFMQIPKIIILEIN